jgi:hypothetical protein
MRPPNPQQPPVHPATPTTNKETQLTIWFKFCWLCGAPAPVALCGGGAPCWPAMPPCGASPALGGPFVPTLIAR